MTDQEKFFAFLEKHGCKDNWIKNMKIYMNRPEAFCKETLPEDYVICAFRWADTSEGQSFWNKINYLWEKEI